jgi:hypothetical protein
VEIFQLRDLKNLEKPLLFTSSKQEEQWVTDFHPVYISARNPNTLFSRFLVDELYRKDFTINHPFSKVLQSWMKQLKILLILGSRLILRNLNQCLN